MLVKLSADKSASESVDDDNRSMANVASSAAKPIYKCPMHPEVQQDHPGNCPKYGIALEPKTVTTGTDDAENADLRDMTKVNFR
jgi:hypothetical protein